ncbi:MAG: cytochrome c [Chloroflexi bacterium]|nr:cytochrome c [Chloroflexota bacterium]
MDTRVVKRPSAAALAVYVTIAVVIVVSLVFLVEFIDVSETEMAGLRTQTPNAYEERVTGLLANADSVNGERLLTQYGCIACHRLGAANNIAPAFVGVAERAATRRPPLSAAEYIYESITQPLAFVVEGFNPVMPQNYPELLPDSDLGDIIAYLLTPGAQ